MNVLLLMMQTKEEVMRDLERLTHNAPPLPYEGPSWLSVMVVVSIISCLLTMTKPGRWITYKLADMLMGPLPVTWEEEEEDIRRAKERRRQARG